MLIDGVHFPVLPASFVARRKGCHLETVYRAIAKGKIKGYQVGHTWLAYNDGGLDAWQPPAPGPERTKHRRPERSRKMKEQG